MKRIQIEHTIVHARAGAVLDECIKEAIIFAVTEWRDVILIHNKREFRIETDKLMEMIMKRCEENKEEEI